MANKKKAKKPAAEEKAGEEVEAAPAIVEVASIKVRGTGVGGTCLMTPTEYAAHLKKNRKKS